MMTSSPHKEAERNVSITKIFKFLSQLKHSSKTEDFLESLQDFFEEKGFLTDKQYEALLNVYERV